MVKIKDFKEVDKIEELGNKICRFVECYEKGKGRIPELAALADILLSIREIFKSYDKRFKKLEDLEKRLKKVEAELGIYTDEEIKEIKIGGSDPN